MKKLSYALWFLGLAAVIFSLWTKPQFPRPKNPKVQRKGASVQEPASENTKPQATRLVTSKSTSSEGTKDLRYYLARLSALDICRNGTCAYPKTDPRSYEFARGQDLKRTLAEMAELARAEHLEQADIASAARKYLSSPDGHVQEGALDLIATQPTSPENMHAILSDVISGYDPQLIEQGLLELQRYGAGDDMTKISQALGESMMSGAPFVAREISARISPFVNANTLDFYKDLAASLPPQSVYRANLEKILADYAKQNG